MRYLDANIFVRYIAEDDAAMFAAVDALFESVDKDVERVAVLDVTVGEVVYVLTSRALYGLPRQEVVDRLSTILSHRGIQMEHKTRCLHALEIFASYGPLDFGDAVVCAAALDEHSPEVYSFDHDFDRVPGITRLEPLIA